MEHQIPGRLLIPQNDLPNFIPLFASIDFGSPCIYLYISTLKDNFVIWVASVAFLLGVKTFCYYLKNNDAASIWFTFDGLAHVTP